MSHLETDAGGFGEMGTHEMAKLLMLTPRRLQQLVREGVLAQVAPGRFDVGRSVQAYAAFLKSGPRPSATASARVSEARAAEIEGRIAEKRRTLIPRDDHAGVIRHIAAIVDEEAAAVAGRLPAPIQEQARAEIDAARRRIVVAAERAATAFDR